MHCNLRLPYINYEAQNASAYNNNNSATLADLYCALVNSAKFNNPRRSDCDLNMSNFSTVRHLGFDQKWIFTIPRPRKTHSAPACQISTKLCNA